jgi:hypothetical protein
MNFSTQNDLDRNGAVIDAEQSLRLIASLPAPEGIEDRLKAGLRSAPIETGVIRWPLSRPNRAGWAQAAYLRGAAAAAIVLMVAGGGWGVYAHFGQAPLPAADVRPPSIGSGGFSSAEARRTPKTVDGPKIATPKSANEPAGAVSTSTKQGIPVDRRHEKKKPSASAPAVR